MPFKFQISKMLDFRRRGGMKGFPITKVAANTAVTVAKSGYTYVIDNSTPVIHMNLPPVNACNGMRWDFIAQNTGKFHIVGDTNVMVDPVGGITTKTVNIGLTNFIQGVKAAILSDGSFYYLSLASAANVAGSYGYTDG